MQEITFYNEPELKESLLRYTKEHQEADAYKRGSWVFDEIANNGAKKGCFYGCMTQSEDNTLEKAAKQYGLPLWYVHVTEKIYEGLPEDEWLEFPYQAIEVLPVGIDTNKIRSLFNYKLLEDQLRFCKENEQVTDAIKECMKLFEDDFDKIDYSAAASAESAAASAAWSAARSAAASAESAAASAESAESAAWSAASAAASAESAAESAESAAESAESAAWSAASAQSAAWSAAASAHYSFLRDLLFQCIEVIEKESLKVGDKASAI